MLNINKTSRTICNGICHKSQQLQLVEIRKMVSVNPAWNIVTCTLQNIVKLPFLTRRNSYKKRPCLLHTFFKHVTKFSPRGAGSGLNVYFRYNMDEEMLEMSKLVPVKIIQTFSQLMKRLS